MGSKKYSLGQPICENIIPNKVLVILKGKARLLNKSKLGLTTIKMLGPNTFIGLASLLNAKGCELVSSSEEIIALAIPDNLILNLYKEEESFRNWCNHNIQTGEIQELAINLQKNYAKNDLDLQQSIELIRRSRIFF